LIVLNQKIVDTTAQLQLASQNMPKIWTGRNAILEMKEGGSKHWKQMEWMGFYFEFLCQTHFDGIIDMPGKKYRNTTFDAFCEISWDFKAHAANTTRHDVITNDVEAIKNTLDDYGYYGIILAIGEVEYNDEQRTFKKWHDELKKGISKYEKNRINRGAMSRRRKTEFTLSEIHFICLNIQTLDQCSSIYQQGRNSNGRPRPPKFNLNVQKIPDSALTATVEF
jgi:hypothetical protein